MDIFNSIVTFETEKVLSQKHTISTLHFKGPQKYKKKLMVPVPSSVCRAAAMRTEDCRMEIPSSSHSPILASQRPSPLSPQVTTDTRLQPPLASCPPAGLMRAWFHA